GCGIADRLCLPPGVTGTMFVRGPGGHSPVSRGGESGLVIVHGHGCCRRRIDPGVDSIASGTAAVVGPDGRIDDVARTGGRFHIAVTGDITDSFAGIAAGTIRRPAV